VGSNKKFGPKTAQDVGRTGLYGKSFLVYGRGNGIRNKDAPTGAGSGSVGETAQKTVAVKKKSGELKMTKKTKTTP